MHVSNRYTVYAASSSISSYHCGSPVSLYRYDVPAGTPLLSVGSLFLGPSGTPSHTLSTLSLLPLTLPNHAPSLSNARLFMPDSAVHPLAGMISIAGPSPSPCPAPSVPFPPAFKPSAFGPPASRPAALAGKRAGELSRECRLGEAVGESKSVLPRVE